MQKNIILISCVLIVIFIILMGYNFNYKNKASMQNFSKSSLSHTLREEMITKNIWSPECPVSLDRLNLLKISYIDFDGNEIHDGALIVHDVVADNVLEIFRILYKNKFPIASLKLINDYDGDDEKSMADNNSSAFICRNIMNSKTASIHSYGLAIDINPKQNPYLITEYEDNKVNIPVFPPQGMEYINRLNIRSGMVESMLGNGKDNIINLFAKNGFTVWGGNWNDPVDWHHFQVTREQAETIAKLSYEDGMKFFNSISSPKK